MTRKELITLGVISAGMEHDAGYIEKQNKLDAAKSVLETQKSKYKDIVKQYNAIARELKASRAEDKQYESFFCCAHEGTL